MIIAVLQSINKLSFPQLIARNRLPTISMVSFQAFRWERYVILALANFADQ